MDETGVIRLIDVEILFHFCRDSVVDHLVDEPARLFGIDDFVAISVNHLALHVHHVIEIECAFSNQIVALLNAFLRRLDRLVQPSMLELLAFLEPEALHDSRHPIGCAEIAHQIVFKTNIKP